MTQPGTKNVFATSTFISNIDTEIGGNMSAMNQPSASRFTHRRQPVRFRRGSAIVFLILSMSIMVTGTVAMMSMVSGVQSQISDLSLKRNAAFYASEAGIQQAVWNMKNNSAWVNTLPAVTTLPNGCTITVSAVGAVNWPSAPVTFQSVGASADGSVVNQACITVASTGAAPGLAVGASLSDSGTLTIAGGVAVGGNVTRSGTMTLSNVAGQPASSLSALGSFTSSGTFNVPGNVLFNGGVTSSGKLVVGGNVQSGSSISHSGTYTVTGSTLANDSPNLSFTTPVVSTATLESEATTDGTVLSGGAFSNKTINFSQAPNGIVYINGNTTLAGTTTIVGTGTLIVAGNLTLSGTLGTAGSPAPLNIVTTNNLTASGTLVMNGALCSGGSLTKSGTTTVTGVVVVQQSVTGSGSITLTYAAPPSFIQYSGAGGAGSNIQTSNFSGATY
jgi:hypothetical protein